MNPKCSSCKKEVKQFSAILLGPQVEDGAPILDNLCKECYGTVKKHISLGDLSATLQDLHDNHAYFQGDNWVVLKRLIPALDKE